MNDKIDKIKKKIKYTKSMYSNTFTEKDEDNDNDKEKYFIKEKDKEMNNKNDETIGPSEQDTVNSNNGIINNSTANISIL